MGQAPVAPRPPGWCKITGYDQRLPGLLRQLSASPASGPDDRLHGEAGRLRCSRMQEMQESWTCQPAPCFASSTIMSEAFSAIMIAGALVLQIGRATSELQSLMRISYAVFCLKKKKPIEYQIMN